MGRDARNGAGDAEPGSLDVPPGTPDVMAVPQGSYRLRRFPDPGERSPLRAWDAADEYLLRHAADDEGLQGLLGGGSRVLVVNDAFGALALALADRLSVTSWSDGVDAFLGLRANAVLNGMDAGAVEEIPSIRPPVGPFALVLLKIPKGGDLLEHQLRVLRTVLEPGTPVLAAGMSRHMGRHSTALFELLVGPAQTSRAWKKARLILASLAPGLDPGPSPFPRVFSVEGALLGGSLRGPGLEAVSHAGVFSGRRVDPGTRSLLEAVPDPLEDTRIADLGCGSGILGVAAAARNDRADVCFTDRSYLAVESARENFSRAFGPGRTGRFLPALGLDGVERGWADLVLNNPPFHDRHAVGDAIAWGMFHEARRVLRAGGALVVVGNRHLGYHAKLKRIFGNCDVVASDRTFVVLRAVREGGSSHAHNP
jgi:16S rRNA (guanine1207-N2)-methyltransferase